VGPPLGARPHEASSRAREGTALPFDRGGGSASLVSFALDVAC
jgi:hypothetical protein